MLEYADYTKQYVCAGSRGQEERSRSMKKKIINILASLGVMVLCGFLAFEYIDHVSVLGLGAPPVRTLKVFLVMSAMLCCASFVYNCMENHHGLAVIQFLIGGFLFLAYWACLALSLNFYYDSQSHGKNDAQAEHNNNETKGTNS